MAMGAFEATAKAFQQSCETSCQLPIAVYTEVDSFKRSKVCVQRRQEFIDEIIKNSINRGWRAWLLTESSTPPLFAILDRR